MEKKVIVIYNSKTGFTKKYAEWIVEELGCEIKSVKDMKNISVKEYDTIIYGAGIYAGMIRKISFIKKQLPELAGKKIIVYTSSLGNPQKEENKKAIQTGIDNNFNKEEQKAIKFFMLRGGIEFSKLGFMSKLVMNMIVKSKEKKGLENLDEEDRLIVENRGGLVDFTKKEDINELLKYVKS